MGSPEKTTAPRAVFTIKGKLIGVKKRKKKVAWRGKLPQFNRGQIWGKKSSTGRGKLLIIITRRGKKVLTLNQ